MMYSFHYYKNGLQSSKKQLHLYMGCILRVVSVNKLNHIFEASPRTYSSNSVLNRTRPCNFNDTKLAFSGIHTKELLRAWFVLFLCGFHFIVRNGESLFNSSRRILGDNFTAALIKPLFFDHFCAGEDEDSIKPRIEFLRQNGIGSILDYAAESDTKKDEQSEIDNRSGVDSARVYDYFTEAQCDVNMTIFESEIRAVHNVTPTGFAAIKTTALGNPNLLERWSNSLSEIRMLFHRLDSNGDNELHWDEFLHGYQQLFKAADKVSIRKLFEQFRNPKVDYIDPLSWTTALRVEDTKALSENCLEEGPFHRATLTIPEIKLMKAMENRVHYLAHLAQQLGVRLMIDAEHSYFQPAIDNIVLNLQRQFNRTKPVVFNTYQCYLKDASRKVDEHIAIAEREGFIFACKIVRGAYMILERERAAKLGYQSPIHETIEGTHSTFHDVMNRIATRKKVVEGKEGANLLVATHNQESVEHALKIIEDTGEQDIYFGQLLGMGDNLTFTLGRNGYKAYKYLPYGPLNEVLPYLVRRAQENNSIMERALSERRLITKEISRRVWA